MGGSQDKNQYTDIIRDTRYQHFQIFNALPETEFYKSITDIKKVVCEQQYIIEIVGPGFVAFHQSQDKYAAIPVKKSSDVDNYKNDQDQVNNICGNVIIHIMQTF